MDIKKKKKQITKTRAVETENKTVKDIVWSKASSQNIITICVH